MNRSANSSDSSFGVTTKVHKVEDGKYVAQALGTVGQIVGPIEGRTESEAMNLHKQAVTEAAAKGKI